MISRGFPKARPCPEGRRHPVTCSSVFTTPGRAGISSKAAAVPGSNAAREAALYGASVKVSEDYNIIYIIILIIYNISVR
jgi:hypothetical protein